MSLSFITDVVIFFFFHSVSKVERFCTFYSNSFCFLLSKTYEVIEFQWQPFQSKKKSIAKTVALNYISPKVYRATHHAQNHKCYLRKPNSKKYNYPIQSNAYLGRKSII